MFRSQSPGPGWHSLLLLSMVFVAGQAFGEVLWSEDPVRPREARSQSDFTQAQPRPNLQAALTESVYPSTLYQAFQDKVRSIPKPSEKVRASQCIQDCDNAANTCYEWCDLGPPGGRANCMLSCLWALEACYGQC